MWQNIQTYVKTGNSDELSKRMTHPQAAKPAYKLVPYRTSFNWRVPRNSLGIWNVIKVYVLESSGSKSAYLRIILSSKRKDVNIFIAIEVVFNSDIRRKDKIRI